MGALQRGGGRQRRGGVPPTPRRGGHRHAGTAQPPARLPLQQVALQPVDREPGVGPPHLLGRAGAPGRGPGRPLAVPPRGAALIRGGHADRPTPAGAVAGDGRARRGPPPPTSGSPCTSSAWPRCTRASPPPSASNSASSGSTPPAPPRSAAAWPSPAGRSTISSCNRCACSASGCATSRPSGGC